MVHPSHHIQSIEGTTKVRDDVLCPLGDSPHPTPRLQYTQQVSITDEPPTFKWNNSNPRATVQLVSEPICVWGGGAGGRESAMQGQVISDLQLSTHSEAQHGPPPPPML